MPVPARRCRSAVVVGAVGDAHDPDEDFVVVDGVDDAVLAPSRGPVALEFEAQRLPDAVRVRSQWPVEEVDRSEEHTSELQSRQYLVCRLLLEKKKTSSNSQ